MEEAAVAPGGTRPSAALGWWHPAVGRPIHTATAVCKREDSESVSQHPDDASLTPFVKEAH